MITAQDAAQTLKASVRRIFFPTDPFSFLKTIFVSMSLLVLLRHASTHTFTDVLALIVETYDSILTRLISPFQPAIDWIVRNLSYLWSIEFRLHGIWKHIFVLLTIYFFSRAGGAFSMRQYGTAIFRLVWGIFVALIFSILASLKSEQVVNFSQEFRIAFSAIGCIAIYELGINIWFATFFRQFQAVLYKRSVRSWTSEFVHLSKEDSLRILFGAVLVTVMLFLPWPSYVTRPELMVLAIVVFLYGAFWLFWGWRQTGFERSIKKRLEIAKTNGDVIVGTAMVRSFLYAFIAVLIDTAAKLI